MYPVCTVPPPNQRLKLAPPPFEEFPFVRQIDPMLVRIRRLARWLGRRRLTAIR